MTLCAYFFLFFLYFELQFEIKNNKLKNSLIIDKAKQKNGGDNICLLLIFYLHFTSFLSLCFYFASIFSFTL